MNKIPGIDRFLYILYGIAALSFLVLIIPFHPYPFSFLLKAIPVSCLIILSLRNTESRVRVLLFFALLFSVGGDIVLDIDRTRFFIFGLIFFLISHVFYMTLFMRQARFSKKKLLPVGFVLIYTIILSIILRNIDATRIVPVYIYLFVIMGMTISAILFTPREKLDFPFLIPIGAGIFMLSDTIIAVNQFLIPITHSLVYSLTLYFTAQVLIISGFVLRRTKS
ncbi:MAG: lysoplasmalogenase [Spirochaetales bacterium]|nr:lysoplasmalogenase [Spirochaetales bacterium]